MTFQSLMRFSDMLARVFAGGNSSTKMWRYVSDLFHEISRNCVSLNPYPATIFVLKISPAFLRLLHIRLDFCNVSDYRCAYDCGSRGRELDPGPVPYFRGDWSWNNFYGHSPPFRWLIQGWLLSVTSKVCTRDCSSLARKKCGYVNWASPMTIAVDQGVNQQHKKTRLDFFIESNNSKPEQSDLVPYCMQYRLP